MFSISIQYYRCLSTHVNYDHDYHYYYAAAAYDDDDYNCNNYLFTYSVTNILNCIHFISFQLQNISFAQSIIIINIFHPLTLRKTHKFHLLHSS